MLLSFMLYASGQAQGQQNLLDQANDFDQGLLTDDPWAGVSQGELTVFQGSQMTVDDNGAIANASPGPSIGIGDLNDDGLPDLVVADARGFFWYFPNSGTPTQPKFTHGEIIPIWIGNPSSSQYDISLGIDNTAPRICLVSLNKNGVLDIVAGNFEGKLYYFRNSGSKQQPKFTMPDDLGAVLVPTRSKGQLWCNYLAPCLYDWWGRGIYDLIMGEGTYSANSIYLLTNQGTNLEPIFNETSTLKIIPGMGREHLVPQVVDWNNDGNPDIITGEREGYIDVFLNTTTDPKHPQFDKGQTVKFGGTDVVGPFTTVAVGDLTGNKLPNLAISDSDGSIFYAENKGKPGKPQFELLKAIHGSNPLPQILPASGWTIDRALGIPYVNLVCTNKNIESDFEPPSPDFTSALKYYTEPHDWNKDFPQQFHPQEDTQWIKFSGSNVNLKPHVRYKVSFWVKSVGNVSNLVYWFWAYDGSTGSIMGVTKPISSSEEWTHFSDSFSYELPDNSEGDSFDFIFRIGFNGQPTLYFDGFKLTEEGH
jgi:hypothetical protein